MASQSETSSIISSEDALPPQPLYWSFFGGGGPFSADSFTQTGNALATTQDPYAAHPLYFGGLGGYGDTTSETQYYAAIVKLLVPLNDDWRVFGDIGAAYVHRSDDIADISNTRPTFGFYWLTSIFLDFSSKIRIILALY